MNINASLTLTNMNATNNTVPSAPPVSSKEAEAQLNSSTVQNRDSLGNVIVDSSVTLSSQAYTLQAKENTVNVKPDASMPNISTDEIETPDISTPHVSETESDSIAHPKAQAYAQYKTDTVYLNEVQLLLDTQVNSDDSKKSPVYMNNLADGYAKNAVNPNQTAANYLINNPDSREPALGVGVALNDKSVVNSYMNVASL